MNYVVTVMEGSAASFSTEESDFSTGYLLEDALIEFGESSKRRRLLTHVNKPIW